jgi:hypothetical protein
VARLFFKNLEEVMFNLCERVKCILGCDCISNLYSQVRMRCGDNACTWPKR